MLVFQALGNPEAHKSYSINTHRPREQSNSQGFSSLSHRGRGLGHIIEQLGHGTVPGTVLESTSSDERGFLLNDQGMAIQRGAGGIGRARWGRGTERGTVPGMVPPTVLEEVPDSEEWEREREWARGEGVDGGLANDQKQKRYNAEPKLVRCIRASRGQSDELHIPPCRYVMDSNLAGLTIFFEIF